MKDQTAKADAGKPDLTLVPTQIIYEIERIRSYGTAKYKDRDNWKRVSIDRYWQATLRHILQAWDDVGAIDHESGLLHISHAACNIAFILELMKGVEAKCHGCKWNEWLNVDRCSQCSRAWGDKEHARTLEDRFEGSEDACTYCKYVDKDENEYPCTSCNRNYVSMFERRE